MSNRYGDSIPHYTAKTWPIDRHEYATRSFTIRRRKLHECHGGDESCSITSQGCASRLLNFMLKCLAVSLS